MSSSALSSSFPSTSTSTSVSSASETSSSSSGLGDPSTLLFVFLISVLSLFSAFLTCGIIWHRLVARRRMIEAMLEAGPLPAVELYEKPKLWDTRVMTTYQLPKWVVVNPLAGQKYGETGVPLGTQSSQPRRTCRRWLTRLVPLEILYLFSRPPPPPSRHASSITPETAAWPQSGSDVRVSVLIQMPYSPLRTDDEQDGGFRELAIGTTDVHYHDPNSS